MSLRPHASWFPWLLFLGLFLHSALDYTLFDPYFGNSDEPLLIAIVAVILWVERRSILASLRGEGLGSPFIGFGLFAVGSMIFTFGRLAPVMILQVWGLFILAAGMVAALSPREYLHSALFIAFSGTLVVVLGRLGPGLLSSELAVAIASVTATVITATLWPVVANGVTLYFGPYSATVTEACSGLNSIFSLMALSLLYLRESVQRSPLHIAFLVACVIPMAVLTNFLRVMLLILATWYVGDWFSQSLFHEASGVVAFVLALFLLSVIDRLSFHVSSMKKNRRHSPDNASN